MQPLPMNKESKNKKKLRDATRKPKIVQVRLSKESDTRPMSLIVPVSHAGEPNSTLSATI